MVKTLRSILCRWRTIDVSEYSSPRAGGSQRHRVTAKLSICRFPSTICHLMRLAFIGGYGHHYLRGALTDPACDIDQPVAVAGDGHDDARAETFARSLPNARWYPDARIMIDQFRPHAVSVGSVYGFNGELAAMVLEAGIPCV